MLELTVTDLKQFGYCARIPYWAYVLPVPVTKPYKVARGHDVQAALEVLEQRRTLRRYGVEAGERVFGLRVRSERLGLSGRLDVALRTPMSCHPVDFKDTEGGVRRNHVLQLAAYALMLEEQYSLAAPSGFVYLVPTQDVVEVPVGDVERAEVAAAAEAIRTFVAAETLPDPTPRRARCDGCEFRNFCADIW